MNPELRQLDYGRRTNRNRQEKFQALLVTFPTWVALVVSGDPVKTFQGWAFLKDGLIQIGTTSPKTSPLVGWARC